MFKQDLEKAEEPEDKLPTSTGSYKKQENSRKTSISALLTMPKPAAQRKAPFGETSLPCKKYLPNQNDDSRRS